MDYIVNFLPLRTPSTNSAERLQERCTMAKRFFGEKAEAKLPPIPPEPSRVEELPFDKKEDHEGQDPVAYAYYDKLFASSKYNNVLLYAQWNCLLERVMNSEGPEPEQESFQLQSNTVVGMLYLCKGLKTNFVVRFRALELFNGYLRRFAEKHEEFLANCSEAEREEFRMRYESQVLLRMCTCILIASKLHADTQVRALTTEAIRVFMASEKFNFSRSNIARSEMRVLETLGYKCLWVTPLELVEQLLSILKLPLESLKRAHYYCILLLEYCYSDLDNIRDSFSKSIKKSRIPNVSSGKITMPLKSAAIVAAALFIVSTETKTEHHKKVAKAASLNEEDVHVLAVLLLDLLNSP